MWKDSILCSKIQIKVKASRWFEYLWFVYKILVVEWVTCNLHFGSTSVVWLCAGCRVTWFHKTGPAHWHWRGCYFLAVLSMNYIIFVFAIIMLVTGIVVLVRPMTIYGFIDTHSQSLKLHIFAVLIRLFLGAALIIAAKNTSFSLVLEVTGWLIVLAGIVLAVMGRKRFKRLVKWAVNLLSQHNRLIGIFSILIGGFLGYSVL